MMRRRDQRGYTESVQWAVLTPVLLLLLLGAIEVGMLWHGRNTVLHAAAAAAEAESAYHGTAGAGHRAAENVAAAGGLQEVQVAVHHAASEVDVEVSASVPLIVDLGLGRVSHRASAPKERAR